MQSLRAVFATLLLFLPIRLLRVVDEARRRRRRVVMTMRLAGSLSETGESGGRFGGGRAGPSTLDVLQALEAAAEDPSVEGIAVTVGGLSAGWGPLEEIRDAVRAVAATGRSTDVFLERPGHAEWYLASAFQRVAMAPMATLDVVGLRAEVSFYKGLLDRLGVRAHLATRGEYKSVVEPFSQEGMSPAFRESLDGVLGAIHARFRDAVAQRLDVDEDAAQSVVDAGPFTAPEALERGLVDAVLYPDRWRRSIKNRLGRGRGVKEPTDPTTESDAAFLDADAEHEPRLARRERLRFVKAGALAGPRRRLRRLERWASPAPSVAVVLASGEIVDSGERELPAGRIGHRPYGELFKALRRDDSIGAVVLRVDSPGGSAGASDLLWRDLRRLAAAKPLVASMAGVAASGGYYMAVAADHIVADASTITGSIGVAAGKFEVGGLLDKLGITHEVLSYGAQSGMNAMTRGFSEAEAERLSVQLDAFYDGFIQRSAAGRRMDPDALEAHARGRIWTGEQAQERGLVDAVGGLRAAVAEAGRRAGLGDDPMVLVAEPARPGWFERIQRFRPPLLGAGLVRTLLPSGVQARLPADITIR